ncbi:MAG TPA: SGNH/GDSL hydrolase family protein, partial [Planctomycetota bacterium]|nr:SGNH/GDSL hydrolase family protein [Planctomycetota bacterium]
LQLVNRLMASRQLAELARQRNEQRAQRRQDPELIGQPDWPGDRRVPLADFEAALRELCAEVAADGARPILCSLPRTPETEARLPILPLYSEVIARVGRELGVPVVDLRAAVLRAVAAGADPDGFFITTDTWHLGPKGQSLLANLLVAELAPAAAR